MRKFLATLALALLIGVSSAKQVTDAELEFSAQVPDRAQVQIDHNEKGRALNVAYESEAPNESFWLSVVRANNGGFDAPLFPIFEQMMEGTSRSVGKRPAGPLRRIPYRGLELFVAQHEGIGPGASQTMTTVVFLHDRGTWRKAVILRLLSRGSRAPTDAVIVDRMNALKFRPAD